jgi:hypothetical protein
VVSAGTGIVLAHSEGGIGGTGAPVWAAATGTVTGFGSIHVNGLRVVFPNGTARTARGDIFRESTIDLGETVEIIGETRADGTIEARYAQLRFALAGMLAVGPDGAMTVGGTAFTVGPGAPVVDATGAAIILRHGDRLAVSGLPRRGQIVASRVERLPPGAPLPVDPGDLLASLASPVENVVVEGYLTPSLAIDGFAAPVDPGSRLAVVGPDRALFIGALADGVFTVRHGLLLPEDATARREKLDAVGNAFAPAGAFETR